MATLEWTVLHLSLVRPQRNGHTALHKAAEAGHADACAYLIGRLDGAQKRQLWSAAREAAATFTTPSGDPLSEQQVEEKVEECIPSALAQRASGFSKRHAACVDLLREAGV